jgi:hypothetical protein
LAHLTKEEDQLKEKNKIRIPSDGGHEGVGELDGIQERLDHLWLIGIEILCEQGQ